MFSFGFSLCNYKLKLIVIHFCNSYSFLAFSVVLNLFLIQSVFEVNLLN